MLKRQKARQQAATNSDGFPDCQTADLPPLVIGHCAIGHCAIFASSVIAPLVIVPLVIGHSVIGHFSG
jgi:hypothetical protein